MPPDAVDPRRNIELKAYDHDPARSLEVCRVLGAVDHGVIQQVDTYFNAVSGRLKLREETPGGACLIQYDRADEPQQRESRYQVVEIEDGTVMRSALRAALGVSVVVAKRRRLHIWRDVRIHLDDVEGLGAFIEFEAVAPHDSDLSEEHARIDELRAAFGIADAHLVAEGYAAQLRTRSRRGGQPHG